jgi:16S rRNA (guanine1207-N2)-methyltransferase
MIDTAIAGIPLRFATAPSLFSPRFPDQGTLAMLSSVSFAPGAKVLDLGCGYGVVGIFAAKLLGPRQVFMLDNDPEAIRCAAKNVAENGVEGVTVVLSEGFADFAETDFDKILCNPPYHADFSIAKHFIEKGFNRLKVGGAMWMVAQRGQWYRNKLTAIFGGVREFERGPYVVLEAQKRRHSYAARRKGS